MSDNGSSNASEGGGDGEPMTMYECRKCPGQRFTAAERDIHRLSHKNDKKAAKPRPKSKQKGRAPSPSRSEVTLFDPVVIRQNSDGEEEVVTPSPVAPKKGAGKRKAPAGSPEKSKKERRKRESIKRFDPEQMATKPRYNSG